MPVTADDVNVMDPGRNHARHHVSDRRVDPAADHLVDFIEPGVIGHRATEGKAAPLLPQELIDVEREPMNIRRRHPSKVADGDVGDNLELVVADSQRGHSLGVQERERFERAWVERRANPDAVLVTPIQLTVIGVNPAFPLGLRVESRGSV